MDKWIVRCCLVMNIDFYTVTPGSTTAQKVHQMADFRGLNSHPQFANAISHFSHIRTWKDSQDRLHCVCSTNMYSMAPTMPIQTPEQCISHGPCEI